MKQACFQPSADARCKRRSLHLLRILRAQVRPSDLQREWFERALDHPESEQKAKARVLDISGINNITGTRAYFQIMGLLKLSDDDKSCLFPECHRWPITEMSNYAKKLPYVIFDTGPNAHLMYPSNQFPETRKRIAELIRTNEALAHLSFTPKLV